MKEDFCGNGVVFSSQCKLVFLVSRRVPRFTDSDMKAMSVFEVDLKSVEYKLVLLRIFGFANYGGLYHIERQTKKVVY